MTLAGFYISQLGKTNKVTIPSGKPAGQVVARNHNLLRCLSGRRPLELRGLAGNSLQHAPGWIEQGSTRAHLAQQQRFHLPRTAHIWIHSWKLQITRRQTRDSVYFNLPAKTRKVQPQTAFLLEQGKHRYRASKQELHSVPWHWFTSTPGSVYYRHNSLAALVPLSSRHSRTGTNLDTRVPKKAIIPLQKTEKESLLYWPKAQAEAGEESCQASTLFLSKTQC